MQITHKTPLKLRLAAQKDLKRTEYATAAEKMNLCGPVDDAGDHWRIHAPLHIFKGHSVLDGDRLTIVKKTPLKTRLDQLSSLSECEYAMAYQDTVLDCLSIEDTGDHWRATVGLYIFKGHSEAVPPRATDADYQRLAQTYNLEVAIIKAINEVESSGCGFLSDGRPRILFEAQWFGYFTNDRYDSSHPHISAKRWDRSLYATGNAEERGIKEWQRLDEAAALDREAALKAASYGLGQVMGLNFDICGFSSVEELVDANRISEASQLDVMMRFIKGKGLLKLLRSKQWESFAYNYNGEGYKQNHYDTKLRDSYNRFCS